MKKVLLTVLSAVFLTLTVHAENMEQPEVTTTQKNTSETSVVTSDYLKWQKFENESSVICLLFDPGISFHYMKLTKVFSLGNSFFEFCAFKPDSAEGKKDGFLSTMITDAAGYDTSGTFHYLEHQNRVNTADSEKNPRYISGNLEFLSKEFFSLEKVNEQFFNSFVSTVSGISSHERNSRPFFCPLGKLFLNGFVILIERHEFSNALKATLLSVPEIKSPDAK